MLILTYFVMPNPFEMIKITFTWTFAFLFYFWPIVLVAFILGLTKFIIRKKLPNLFYFLNNRRSSYSETKVTRQALALYEALEDRNINCEIEKWDGYHTIHIPNRMIDNDVNDVADAIEEIVNT